ncbi:MAG: S-4TM family putative pore-forming effector [Clostridia bacterium]
MNRTINKEQNKKEYLRYRYVSRLLYSQEKKYRGMLILVGIIIYTLGFIPKVSELPIVLLTPVIWVMISELIKKKLSNIHKKAVDYHEYNDRVMFGLAQLTALVDNKNSLYQEAINITNDDKYKVDFEQMSKKESSKTIKDWYNNFKGVPTDISIIMAQSENVNWEKNQRKIYRFILITLLMITTLSSGIIIYFITNKIENILFAIPIIWDIIVLLLDNKESISKCDMIIDKIGEVYNHIKDNGKSYDSKYINDKSIEIQFKIYENRKESIPVSDKVYYMYREKLQDKSNAYIKSLKSDIKTYLK